jgi:hypothetical protein
MTSEVYVYYIDIKNQDDGEYMMSMKLDGSPDFIEGRTLTLTKVNRSPKTWNVEDIPETAFKIVKVEYNVHESYLDNNYHSSSLDIWVYLEKLEEV